MKKSPARRDRSKLLTNPDIGYAIFDRDLKLINLNKSFASMHVLPDAMHTAGTDFSEFCRFDLEQDLHTEGEIESELKSRLTQIRNYLPCSTVWDPGNGRTLHDLVYPIDSGGVLFLSMDISSYNQLEAALEASEARYALVERALTEGLYEWNIEESTLNTSSRMNEIFGVNSGTQGITNWNWNARVHPDDTERYTDTLKQHFTGGTESYECEYRVRDESNQYRWVLDRGVCIRDEIGRAQRLIGAITDLTEHVDREIELAKKTAILETILENMDQGISLVDQDLNVIAFNQQFLSLLEFPSDKFKFGYHMSEAFRYNAERGEYGPGDVEALVEERLELARKFEPHHFERARPDGTVIEIHGVPLRHRDGFVTTYTDVTERRRAEEKLKQQNIRLREEIEAHGRSKATIEYLVDEIKSRHNFEEIIGESDLLTHALGQLEQVAETDSTVLIQGETGTGKELFVRAIHNLSNRKTQPLVKVNCATLPRELVESELFGHEKGAFTGATEQRKGRFELADKGTIFLDEAGELPLEAQAKLLRVLQEQEFERVGGTRTIHTDVRVIAATNRNLAAEIEAGRFRSDLYYRLSVFPLTVPPLRERRSDIPLLANFFLDRGSRKLGKWFDGIAGDFMSALMDYPWQGNIRELENVIERAVILSPGPLLEMQEPLGRSIPVSEPERAPQAPDYGTLEEMECAYIKQVLQSTTWTIEGPNGAAKILGLNPSTLRGRMRKLGIRKPR